MSKKTFEVRIAPDECKGCERCVIACPRSVLKMGVQLNRLGVPFVIRTEQECIGCGGCFLTCPEPVPHRRSDRKRGGMMDYTNRMLLKGNEAVVYGALLAGCECFFGYPITPASEIAHTAARCFPKLGRTFLQAECEIAAINMVMGAAANGRRAMTASSGLGISLKQEGISYLSGSELPALVVDIMRGGPGLGNIGPEQSDYNQVVKGGGHGSYRCIVLAPGLGAGDVRLPAPRLRAGRKIPHRRLSADRRRDRPDHGDGHAAGAAARPGADSGVGARRHEAAHEHDQLDFPRARRP